MSKLASRNSFFSSSGKPLQIRIFLLLAVVIFTETALGQGTKSAAPASASAGPTSERVPGVVFRDCPDCPEMVVIPAGNFMMGSSEQEKTWAATHGANAESVADESPQHSVSLRSFALGKYDVTRAEYARLRSRDRASLRRWMP